MSDVDHAEYWYTPLQDKQNEIERLRAARDRLHERNAALSNEIERLRAEREELRAWCSSMHNYRQGVIEECARVAHEYLDANPGDLGFAVADAIRALKDKP